MKKPYFAKYLLVEGEIEEGDRFWYKGYKMTPLIKGKGVQRAVGIENPIIERVKLFLCSRDIQVGDKNVYSGIIGVFEEDNNGPEIIAEIKEGYQLDFIKGISEASKVVPFKVIGEISPEATWIKEGDEFGEDDWRVREYYEDGRIGELDKNLLKYPVENYEIIELKGPCGRFH